MKLSPHFSLSEFTLTSTGLPNDPTPEHLENLQELCAYVLEPIRMRVGRLKITSGYRTAAVNEALRKLGYKASQTSQHMRGQAGDCRPLDMPLDAAWGVIVTLTRGLIVPVDQAIVYVRPEGQGWLHISHSTSPRRDLRVDLVGQERTVTWDAYKATGAPVVLR